MWWSDPVYLSWLKFSLKSRSENTDYKCLRIEFSSQRGVNNVFFEWVQRWCFGSPWMRGGYSYLSCKCVHKAMLMWAQWMKFRVHLIATCHVNVCQLYAHRWVNGYGNDRCHFPSGYFAYMVIINAWESRLPSNKVLINYSLNGSRFFQVILISWWLLMFRIALHEGLMISLRIGFGLHLSYATNHWIIQ